MTTKYTLLFASRAYLLHMPDRSMEIKRVDEETISYRALFKFDVIV
jgi:hypothetical protein